MMTENMSTSPVPLSDRSQWFGVLAGPLTWFVHMILFYLVAEFGCTPGGDLTYFSYTAVSSTIIAITLLGLLVPLAGGIVSYRNLRRLPKSQIDRYLKLERAHYMSWLGLVSSVLFAIAMLVEMSVVFFFSSCVSIMG